MLCWSLSCCLTVVTTNHSGHVISRLSRVNSAQRCAAQCRTATDLSRHTQGCHPVSVCAICKTKGHSFSNEACVRQLLQCTAEFDWCKRFKDGRSSTEDLAHSCHPPHIQTQTHTPKYIKWCSVIVQCFIISVNTLASVWNICITSSCTFWCRFQHYGYLSVKTTNKLTWLSAWNICCSMKEREMSFWIVLLKGTSPGVYNPGTKCTSQQWQHLSHPPPSTGKVMPMPTLFIDHRWPSADRLVTQGHHCQCWLPQWNPEECLRST